MEPPTWAKTRNHKQNIEVRDCNWKQGKINKLQTFWKQWKQEMNIKENDWFQIISIAKHSQILYFNPPPPLLPCLQNSNCKYTDTFRELPLPLQYQKAFWGIGMDIFHHPLRLIQLLNGDKISFKNSMTATHSCQH